MKIHSLQYDTSLKQGYFSGFENSRESQAEMYNNNRGYNVAFNGGGASKKASEAAVKAFQPFAKRYIRPVIDKDTLMVDPNFFGEKYAAKLEKNILSNPKKYPHGLKGGEYPEYKEGFEKTLWGRIVGSDAVDKSTDFFHIKPSVAQAFMALFVAGMLRPATNIAMAGKDDKEDSIYAASHAIASAVIGYVASATILAPFNDAFKEIAGNVKHYLKGKEKLLNVYKIGPRAIETSARWNKLAEICKFSFDSVFLGIPKAMLTIALIPPILKYVFGIEKKPKGTPQQNDTYSKNFIDKSAFLGGVK